MHMPEIRIHKNRPKIYHPIRQFEGGGEGEETEEIAMNCQNRLQFYKMGKKSKIVKNPL